MIFLRGGSVLSDSAAFRPSVAMPTLGLHIATHGDSLTSDLGVSNYSVVLKALVLSGQSLNAKLTQRGINGISYNYRWPSEPYTATLTEDAVSVIDATKVGAGVANWLVVFAGTNGMALNSNTAATEYANFKTYIAARIAAGWVGNKIVVCTMLPRTGFTDATRQTFNTSLVGDDGAYGYRLARLDQNANIGDAGDDTNTTYFYDGTHLTAAGHSIVAGIIYGAMFP